MSSSFLNFLSSSIIFFSPFFLIMQVSSSSSNHPIIMNLSSLFVTMSPYHHIAIMILHQVLSPSSYFPPLSLPQIVIPPRPFFPRSTSARFTSASVCTNAMNVVEHSVNKAISHPTSGPFIAKSRNIDVRFVEWISAAFGLWRCTSRQHTTTIPLPNANTASQDLPGM